MEPSIYQKLSGATSEKALNVEEARTRKQQALDRISASVAYRNSWEGQVAGLGTNSDLARSFSSGVVGGTGAIVDGVAGLTGSEALENTGDWFAEGAQNIRQSRSGEYQDNVTKATPTGDLFSPSTWDLGDGNLEGLGGLLAETTGQMAPQLAAGAVTGGVGAAVVGGAQAAGGASRQQWEYVDALSHDELMNESGLYRDLVVTGSSPEDARKEVRETAARAAGLPAAVIGGAGGAATHYILSGLPSALSKALPDTLPGKVASHASTAGISAVEEGIQEAAEAVTSKSVANAAIDSDQQIDEGVFTDLVLGAGTGGAISAGKSSLKTISATADLIDKGLAKTNRAEATPEEVATLSDPTSDAYDPVRVARTAYKKLKEDPESDGAAQIDSLVSEQQSLIENIKLRGMASTEEGRAQLQAVVERAEARLVGETDTEERSALENTRDTFNALLQEGEDADTEVIRAELGKANTTLSKLERFRDAAQTNQDVGEDLLSESGTDTSETRVNRTVVRAMNNPDAYTPEQLSSLVTQSGNGLTSNQRAYLRALGTSQERLNTTGDNAPSLANTQKGVYYGTDGFKGLKQYRKDMATAVRGGNVGAINRELQGIRLFRQSHTEKASAVQAAYADAQQTGSPVQVVRTLAGNWEPSTETLTDAALRENGGLLISARSGSLVSAIQEEAATIGVIEAELKALKDVRNPVTEEPTNFGEISTSETSSSETQTVPASEPAEGLVDTAESTPEPESVPNVQELIEEAPTDETNDTEAEAEESTEQEAPAEPEEVEAVKLEAGALQFPATPSTKDGTEVTTNLLHKYGKQSAGSSEAPKALVTIKNLASYVKAEGASVLQDLTGKVLTDTDLSALSTLLEDANVLGDTVQVLFREKKEGFQHQDWLGYFSEAGELPENVTTAIGIAAIDWAGSNVSSLGFNTDEDIRRILSMDKSEQIPSHARNTLRKAGARREFVVRDIGRSAVRMLGISLTNAPKNYRSNLETALGMYGVMALQEQGVLGQQRVTGMRSLVTDTPDPDDKTNATFLPPVLEGNRLPSQSAALVRETKAVRNLLPVVFGSESAVVGPVLESPEKWSQKRINNSLQGVPAALAEAQEAAFKRPWHIRSNGPASSFLALSREAQERIVGIQAVTPAMHVNEQERIESKNEGLRRELNHFQDFIDTAPDGLSQRFWLRPVVWSVQRAGLQSQQINPQTSKIHRHLVSLNDWRTPVSTDRRSKSFRRFSLALAVGLGIDVDKQPLDHTYKQMQDKWVKYAEAIDVLIPTLDGEVLTSEQEAIVAEAVADAGEAMHSFDALVNMAQWEKAKRTGQKEFTTDIMFEVDGVTNGPMLTHLFMGVENTAEPLQNLVERGGFFKRGSEFKSFGDFKNQKKNDLYETLATTLHHVLNEKEQSPAGQAIQSLVGNIFDEETGTAAKAGRNLVKTPVTASTFGSSIGKVLSSMADEVLTKVERQIEALAAEGADASELISKVNTVLQAGGATQNEMLPPTTAVALLKHRWTPKQVQAFNKGYEGTYGQAVKEAIERQSDGFLENRKTMNNIANTSYEAFKVVYEAVREDFKKELLRKGRVKYRTNNKGERIAIADLTPQQEKELDTRLKNALPIVHTYFSKLEGVLQNGLGVYKQKNVPGSTGNGEEYLQETNVARAVDVTGDKPYKSMSIQGLINVLASPGVGTLIKQVHSSDSAISASVYGKLPTLNLHDANGMAINQIEEVAEAMNKATFDVLANYSIPMENVSNLTRVLKGTTELQQRYPSVANALASANLASLFQGNLEKMVGKGAGMDAYLRMAKGNPINAYLMAAHQAATQMERNKLHTLKNVGQVNQYSFEGGHYQITKQDRDLLDTRLTELEALPNPGQTLDTQSLVSGEVAPRTVTAEPEELIPLVREALRNDRGNRGLRQALKHLVRGDTTEEVMKNLPEASAKEVTDLILSTEDNQAVAKDKFMLTNQARVVLLAEQLQGLYPQWDADLTSFVRYVKEESNTPNDALDRMFSGDVFRKTAFTDFLSRAHQAFTPTPWGPLGEPVQSSDPELVAYLSEGKRTSGEVLKHLIRTLQAGPSKDTQEGKYYVEMAKQLLRVADRDVPVKLVTPRTKEVEGTYDYPVTAAALYVKGKSEQILVKSPEFKYSNVTPEALIHEMVHATTTVEIQNPGSARSKAAVEQLEAVLDVVKGHLATTPEQAKRFAPAVTNVDELLAWGLTNRDFQKYLSGITFKTGKKPGGLVSALRSFLSAVADLLGIKDRNNALAAVVINGAELMQSREQDADARTERVVRSMDVGDGTSIRDWTAKEVLSALNGPDEPRLTSLMDSIVEKVHGPAGTVKNEVDSMAAYNPRDVYLSALVGGKMPFYSQVRNHFRLSEKEAFVLEQVQLSVDAALEPTSLLYREMRKLHNEAKKVLKPSDFHQGDWARANTREKAQAEAQYNFLFDVRPAAGGRSNYLSEFAALVSVYAPLRDRLNQLQGTDLDTPQSLVERVENWISRLLDLLAGKLYGVTSAGSLDKRMESLLQGLGQVEANRKMTLEHTRANSLQDRLEMFNTATDRFRGMVGALGERLQNNSSSYVGALGTVLTLNADDRIGAWETHAQKVRNRMFEGRQGLIAGLVTEIKGETEANTQSYALLREANKVEKAVVQETENVRRLARESFDDAGSYLTEEDTYALTASLMETDLVSTLGEYTLNDWENMILDDDALEAEITRLSEQVRTHFGVYGDYVVRGALDLGFYQATGINRNPNLALNVHTLLSLKGTTEAGNIAADLIDEHAGVVDVLASLMAVRSTSYEHRAKTYAVMQRENARGDQSGVLTLLRLQEKFKEESMEKLFGGNPHLMRKGFIKEIFNHHNDVVVASETEGRDLEALGYRKAHEVQSDPADPDINSKHIYVADGAGLRRRETGIVNFVNKKARGSSIDSVDVTEITEQKQSLVKGLFSMQGGYNPEQNGAQYLVPLRNDAGDIVAYRYTMTTHSKDTLMERHNAFDDVLGGMAGNLLNKTETKETNTKAVQLLKDLYTSGDYDPEDFVLVHADADDPEIKETFRLMSTDMRNAIRQVWGGDEIYVPVELYDLFFGYRRKSLSGVFDKPEEARNALEQVLVNTLEAFFGKEAALKLTRAENMWMEAINVLKDILVIKNLFTLVGNIVSNFSVLAMHGVSLKEQVKNHKIATQSLVDYQRDSGELLRLQKLKDAGINTGRGLEQDITRLEDAIARNPIKVMVDAGLVHTIVEDIENDDDRFSYKTRFTNWVEDKAEKVPDGLREVGKHLLMTHDTPQYKLLYRATSTSDFAARFVLLRHLMQRSSNPLTQEEALRRVDSEFVNYDIPTHSTMDYFNRMGFALFTKYYLRIQKVLFTLYREQPLRSLLVSLLGNMIDGVQTLSDSAFWGRFGNLTSSGVLELPGAVDEIVPLKVLTSLTD